MKGKELLTSKRKAEADCSKPVQGQARESACCLHTIYCKTQNGADGQAGGASRPLQTLYHASDYSISKSGEEDVHVTNFVLVYDQNSILTETVPSVTQAESFL